MQVKWCKKFVTFFELCIAKTDFFNDNRELTSFHFNFVFYRFRFYCFLTVQIKKKYLKNYKYPNGYTEVYTWVMYNTLSRINTKKSFLTPPLSCVMRDLIALVL